MNDVFKKSIAYIGSFGPLFLFGVIAVTIFSRGADIADVLLFLAWIPIGLALNSTLKWVFNEPRPNDSIHLNAWERYLDKGTKGMPSGHAQFVGSEMAMVMCMGLPMGLQVYSSIQSGITLWQRYVYKKHTIAQLCAGFLIGVLYSIFYYSFLKRRTISNQNT